MGAWTSLLSSLRGGSASAIRFRSPKQELKSSEETIQLGLSESHRLSATGVSERWRSMAVCGPSSNDASALKERYRRPGRRLDHGRLCCLAIETDAEAVFSTERETFVPIGERTSDNGVRVRQKGFSMCTAGFPYFAGCLAVPAPSADRQYRTWDTEGGR